MLVATEILAPVVALVLWTMVMWCWMYATRVPAILKSGMEMDADIPNGVQMSQLPAVVRWKADNYNHLLQQPILFYVVCFTLALTGAGSGLGLTLAWCYVASRVIHSLHQSLWNKIELRFGIFVASSLILWAMAIHLALQVF